MPGDKHERLKGVMQAKYAAPRSRSWVKRPRLFRQLEQCLQQSLIWIGAPAGSGKTVLVASFLQDRQSPVLWYSLDSGDSDPATLFYHLRQALKNLLPDRQLNLPALSPDCLPGLELFAANYFREVYRALPSATALVFDNVQILEPADDFLRILTTAVRQTPHGNSIVCLSRSNPPPILSRKALYGDMAQLSGDDLKWNDAEIAELASSLCMACVPPSVVSELQDKTQGWSAGLVLLLREAVAKADGKLQVPSVTGKNLQDYFATEVLQRLEPTQREFLLKTAILPEISANLASQLTGDVNAESLLESLVERNFFTIRLHGETWRYHPLFREFLLHQAGRMLAPEVFNQNRLRAAELLINHGDNEAAAILLVDAQHWALLAGLICSMAPSLISHGRHQYLLDLFAQIPLPVVDDNPWLLYWQGAALMPVDFTRSHQQFAQAFDAFARQGDNLGLALSWAGAVETIVHSLAHTERLDAWVEKLNALNRFSDLPNTIELQLYIAPQVVAIYALRGKMDPQLETWLALAQAVLEQPIDPTQRIMASFALVAFFHWSGQPARSAPILKKQELILASGDVTPLARVITRLCAAWFSWIYGDFELCARAIEDGLEVVKDTGVQHWTFILIVQGTTNALIRNELREAERYLKRLEPMQAQARDMDRAYYHNELGWLEMLTGRPEHALHQQQLALELAESVGAPFVIAEVCFGLTQACHAVGDIESAARYLERARQKGELYGSQTLAFQCGLLQAWYQLEAGDTASAHDTLGKTFAQAKRLGHAAFAWWRQDVVANLCRFALEQGIEPVFTRNLIRQFAILPPPDVINCENWPWPVRITTLGHFVLEVGEKQLVFDRKVQKKPLALLKALIALGSRDVPEARLNDALWPEADADLAHQNLKATLHRLRKLVGAQTITACEGRISLDRRYCWVDVLAFEALAVQLETTMTSLDAVAARQAFYRIKKLYQGNFFGGEMEAYWLLAPREHHRARFLGLIESLGEQLIQAGDFQTARECFEYGLEIDPLIEYFYRGLMRSYWGLGRPAEVRTVLDRCRQILTSTLGIDCSPETRSLANPPDADQPVP